MSSMAQELSEALENGGQVMGQRDVQTCVRFVEEMKRAGAFKEQQYPASNTSGADLEHLRALAAPRFTNE